MMNLPPMALALTKLKVVISEAQPVFIVAIEGLVAFGVGIGLVAVGAGSAAWILGGIVAGAVVYGGLRLGGVVDLVPNRSARKLGQIIIGLSIGLSLQNQAIATLLPQIPIFLGLPLFLLLCAGAIGWLYAQLEKTDLLTGVLATTPGNIGVMASLAGDYSKNAALVSLVQLLRFTAIILLVPLVVNGNLGHDREGSLIRDLQQSLSLVPIEGLLAGLAIAMAALVIYWSSRWKIPVAGFVIAIGVGLILSVLPMLFALPISVQLPPLFNLMGQILLGMTIGEYWGLNPQLKRETMLRAIAPVLLIFAAGVATAGLARVLTHWDWLTCFLVAAPGGSPEMIWIALSMHHDVEVVTTSHLVRLLTINLALPLVISIATAWDQRRSTSAIE